MTYKKLANCVIFAVFKSARNCNIVHIIHCSGCSTTGVCYYCCLLQINNPIIISFCSYCWVVCFYYRFYTQNSAILNVHNNNNVANIVQKSKVWWDMHQKTHIQPSNVVYRWLIGWSFNQIRLLCGWHLIRMQLCTTHEWIVSFMGRFVEWRLIKIGDVSTFSLHLHSIQLPHLTVVHILYIDKHTHLLVYILTKSVI